jgi:ferredoxin
VDVEVDADCCGGFGQCVMHCPEVFELTDAGYAVVRVDAVPADLEDAVRRAEQSCPTHAITVS